MEALSSVVPRGASTAGTSLAKWRLEVESPPSGLRHRGACAILKKALGLNVQA
jgi:hypothetical protein